MYRHFLIERYMYIYLFKDSDVSYTIVAKIVYCYSGNIEYDLLWCEHAYHVNISIFLMIIVKS